MAELVQSPGHLPFDKYRAFKNVDREGDEPFRFVDGELVERFLDVSESLQEEICNGLGPSVEDIRNMVEELKRLHWFHQDEGEARRSTSVIKALLASPIGVQVVSGCFERETYRTSL
jgi:hypothetical protein